MHDRKIAVVGPGRMGVGIVTALLLSGRPHFKPPASVVEKMERGEIGPRGGKGYFDYDGVDVPEMMLNRYRGFLELLKLVRRSGVLDFQGGVRP